MLVGHTRGFAFVGKKEGDGFLPPSSLVEGDAFSYNSALKTLKGVECMKPTATINTLTPNGTESTRPNRLK